MNIFPFIAGMSKKEKIGIAIALSVLAFAFLDRFVAAPISAKFKKIGAETKMTEQALAQNLRNLNQKDRISREYQKYLPYVKTNYSDGEEVNKLLEAIEDMARKSGLSIGNIKPQPPKDTDIYKYFLIEVDVEGKMDALVIFLHQLAASKELFRANKIYITLKEKETSIARASILVTKVIVR
ncbi:MAG: type 4a pilus biogenesis protein PilO [Candidatus Omnitrophica bacterium]|nr:type 4a pilus biogenesis protein PilO [Candidatus Omnitrophota bacterium]